MKFNLEIHECANDEEFMRSDSFKEFEKHCEEYCNQVEADAKNGLSDDELRWVKRWSDGDCLDWKTIPKNAHDAILYMISKGLG